MTETPAHRADRPATRRGGHGTHHWRHDLIELAALFTAVTVADSIAKTVAHGPDGPVLLMVSAAALLATAGIHLWWSRRRHHPPPDPDSPARQAGAAATSGETPAPSPAGPTGEESPVLWRLRTTVREEPGSLAALCGALAEYRVDVVGLQTHPLGEVTVDEFMLRAPWSLEAATLRRAVSSAGGRETWLERADAHDMVDVPTRVLELATRTALDSAELPLALRRLLGRCTIRSVPARTADTPRPEGVGETGDAGDAGEDVPQEGVLEGTTMRLRDPRGGTVAVERPHLPFTPTEFARARALVRLDALLDTQLAPHPDGAVTPGGASGRMPRRRERLTLREGNEITVRRADTRDLQAARAMHRRCSTRTLSARYHGPVKDADRYLDHLLSPRFGRTLAAETPAGKLVALGHLLWDGDETEVALLVEDVWQRRGIGAELLRRLVEMAAEARSESVYAVTQASNTGMVAAMRGLGLPLDYQVEEGTLVITARLAPVPATTETGGH
ncbi:GNAT family N-acetyltransferase [Streptomyces sp. TRM43335]|uniref:GNAT family N-acetyltransferase n=1 Tax=Streptomyces taklimakanensis TaxID=2569853 RepID=A0A6G2BJC9_9ACTN|nr:GNAT family N-acetyltransferase [Streptomyces taklimakanensis]MTE22163.1 GNAT family N-acetyltransferase [Streptomyces taklimakanensis]